MALVTALTLDPGRRPEAARHAQQPLHAWRLCGPRSSAIPAIGFVSGSGRLRGAPGGRLVVGHDRPLHDRALDDRRHAALPEHERHLLTVDASFADRRRPERTREALILLAESQRALWCLPRALDLRRHVPQQDRAPR